MTCETDDNSGGDITDVTAGTGLTGGGSNGAVTLNVNQSVTQNRVNGTCVAGSSIRAIAQDGTVTCETDDGTSGQDATTAFGIAPVTITPTTAFTLVPGLTQTVTVPANADTVIATDGGIQTTSADPSTGYSVVDVAILVDGILPANGGYRRVYCLNNAGIANVMCDWSLAMSTALTAGSHTITVQAQGVSAGGSNATVSGNSSSVLQGELTVMFLKQ